MPQLEGLSYNTETIRTYYGFSISFAEFVQSNRSPQALMQYFIERGVSEICSSCIKQGYYIRGLEKGFVEEIPSVNFIKQFRLLLGLYVQSFSDKLTNDELWYYSSRAAERIISELSQSLYGNPITQSERKMTVESLEKVKSLLDANVLSIPEAKSIITEQLSSVKYTKTLDDTKTEPKKYNIIRRPKLCSSLRS